MKNWFSFSGATENSPGAQKKTVFGPAAWFHNGIMFFGTIGVVAAIIAEYNFDAIFGA